MMNKKGFAYFFAILFGLLIIEFAYCVKVFKDRGAHLVDYESESYISYMVAESGLNCALEEIKANFEWKTDDITIDSDNALTFSSSDKPNCIIKGNDKNKFYIKFKDGTYQGKMKIVEDDDALFKVKAGMLETKDNPNTSNLDESKIFYLIRSYGKFGEQYKGIDTIVEIAYANRFIIFDGKDALISYGSSSSEGEDTYIADGDIYGRDHVLIGVPTGSNTRIHLKNIKNITTGKNGYMCFQNTGISDISIYDDSTENKLTASDFNLVNTKVREIEAGSDASVEDKKIKTFGGILKDKYTGGRDFDVDYNNLKSFYRSLAEGDFADHGSGIVITRDSADVILKEYKRNKYVDASAIDGAKFVDCDGKKDDKYEVMMIDFGDLMLGDMDVSDDFGDPEDNKIPESLKPKSSSNFNGIIYSEVPLVIWGNPDRDLIIYSEYDIYIAGDFNNRRNVSNDTLTGGDNALPVKQNYLTVNGLKYIDYDDYVQENALWRENNPDYNQGVYWNNIDIISETRVWYDFSDPKKSLKNELIPFIQYEIYKRLFYGGDGTDLTDIVLDTSEVYKISGGKTILEEARTRACVIDSADPAVYDFDENTGFTVDAEDGVIKTCLIDILFSSDLSEIKGSNAVYGNTHGTLKDYFVNTLYFSEDSAELFLDDIISLIKDVESGDVYQKVTREEFKEYIEQKLWNQISDKAFVYSILKDDGTEQKGIVNRLYETVNFKDGLFKQEFSAGGSYADDLLYVPECTINAKRISMGILVPNIGFEKKPGTTNRWDCDVSKIDNIKSADDYKALDEIKKVNTIRPVLGNSYNTSSYDMHGADNQLKEIAVEAEIADGYYRYMANDQMFLRTHGSELYLRNMKDLEKLPYISGGYGPHIRKKIFDPYNRSKYEPRSYNVVDINYYSISEKMFEDF